MRILLLLVFTFFCQSILAQYLIGVGTRYNDSFREWTVHTDIEDYTGKLELRWSFDDNWSTWDFRLGDTTATIRQKWNDDPNLWEIDCLGVRAVARTTWRGEFRQWKINDGVHQFNWQSRYGNVFNEWMVGSERNGWFSVYAYWEDDPREWVIVDELDEEVSLALRLAMVFITLHHSTPKI